MISTWKFVHPGGRYPIVFAGKFNPNIIDINHRSHLGQLLCAFAQTFTLFIPTKFAFVWFPEHQRTLANSLCFASKSFALINMNFHSFVSILSKFLGRLHWHSSSTDHCFQCRSNATSTLFGIDSGEFSSDSLVHCSIITTTDSIVFSFARCENSLCVGI